MSAALFGMLALLLTGPVPLWLSKAQWPTRAPRPAIVLWQAIALAAVLSAFSCGLVIASWLLAPGSDGRPTTSPAREIERIGLGTWLIAVCVFVLTLVVGARLIASMINVAVNTRRRRAHHRLVVDILDRATDRRRDQADAVCAGASIKATDLRILAIDEPLAYCLPGLRQRVVLSEGTINQLSDDELAAVLSHERAHLRARHDLVLEGFTAVHAAFPRFVRSSSALDAVALLIELLADDHAADVAGRRPLARALVTCSHGSTPRGALALGGTHTLLRVTRLAEHRASLKLALAVYTGAGLLLVVPTIAVAVPWLTELRRLIVG